MMKNLRYIWIATLCLALIGCSRETVKADINSDTNSTVETAKDTDIADEAKQENDLIEESDIENPVPEEEEIAVEPKYFTIDLSGVKETHIEGEAVEPLKLQIISEEYNNIDWANDWYERENLSLPMMIMVSPTHVPFEGTRDKKSMSGRSVATFQGKNIPFVPVDFSSIKASRYYKHPDADYRVMGMWIAYHNAYQNKADEKAAWLHLEKTNARILLIAGAEDEAWPAEYSVKALKKYLDEQSYEKEVKVILYPHGSHLNGLMPNRQREKRLYRMIPLIGLMYKTFGKYRKENMEYFEQTEQEIIHWIQ